VVPSVAGPKRPQDRIELPNLKREFVGSFSRPVAESGFGKKAEDFESASVDVELNGHGSARLGHGSVLIAAITSCTNTSNPSVMLAAGLLAKKAVERGLSVGPAVKSSLAPGLAGRHRLPDPHEAPALPGHPGLPDRRLRLHDLHRQLRPAVGPVEDAIAKNDLVAASVLSGNRNFEARVHQSIKANFLMSPPLVVAFALAGRVDIDMDHEPLGKGRDGRDVFLRDIWPTLAEIKDLMQSALKPEVFQEALHRLRLAEPKWNEIPSSAGDTYAFDPASTYIQEPPFFAGFSMQPGAIAELAGARALGVFGDSVTTDHISPAGSIKKTSPAGKFLLDSGVAFEDFNSYGSRRGNDRVMTRGTFANVRIKNLMLGGEEGGNTLLQPEGTKLSIFDAAAEYRRRGVPLVIIAGQEYGTGSSRDWAAKGTQSPRRQGGRRAELRADPPQQPGRHGRAAAPVQGRHDRLRPSASTAPRPTRCSGLGQALKPQQDLTLRITRAGGETLDVPVRCRIDTPIEIDYYQHGGILPYVLRQILAKA
jgi:aconitate hydratase